MRAWLLRIATILGLLLTACGGPGSNDSSPGPADPVSKTITADGGVIEVRGGGGSKLRLEFPSGAVANPLALTVIERPKRIAERASNFPRRESSLENP